MMNTSADFLSYGAHALGWTLVHSLWQALVVLLLLMGGLRLLPTAFARSRYTLACVAFGAFVIVTIITFAHQLEPRDTNHLFAGQVTEHVSGPLSKHEPASAVKNSFSAVSSTIESCMPAIVSAWMLGLVFFTVRLFSSIRYSVRLRSTASILEGDWSAYVSSMAQRIGIAQLIRLATSGEVTTPMVIGYLRPVIILPIGMLSGLTTEQIETVLIHELAHIRRHDYLINFMQSVIETIFFFNPFTWILSNIIRREREYCCDDLVISHHGGTKAYAHALAQLATARFSAPDFAMNLGAGKYQLLNRIQRIMETSVKNYPRKSRMVIPAVLIVTAMMSISWLGIHSENENNGLSSADVAQDTVIDKTKGGAKYSRKRIITHDETGQPHEEVIEVFEGDESLRPLLQESIPGLPDISAVPPDVPMIPPLPDVWAIPPVPAIPDSVPFPRSSIFNEQEWEEFAKAFGEKFSKRFESLDAFRNDEFADLFKGFEEKFRSQDWPNGFELNIPQDVFDGFKHFNDSAMFEDLERQLEKLNELEIDLKELEGNLRLQEDNFQKFESALREELINDGYLSETESIETLQWSDDSFEVNGKAVAEDKLKKYQALQKKYTGEERD